MKRTILLVALAWAAVLVGCAPQEPVPDGSHLTYPTDERPLDSIALIDQAFAEGRIDYTTSLLYKVYAAYDPMSLPPEFESDVPAKCGTPLVLEVQRNWHRFTPGEQAEIGIYIQPISDPDDPVDTDLDDVTRDHLDQERERDRID
jgi:hypothetical protein